MTPTEQDKELQKAVWASLASQMTHAINCTDPEHEKQDSCVDFTEKNFEQLVQLITADRKRVALEARVDEIEHIAGFTHGMTNQMFKNLQNRIAELKAQQEVNG